VKNYIADNLNQIKLNITPEVANSVNKLVLQFEIRDHHPNTLNSNVFGVHKFIFMTNDRDMLFDIFNVNISEFQKIIRDTPSINEAFKVVSDAFNLLCIFIVHQTLSSKLSSADAHKLSVNVLNYLQYRIMSSAINHYFPYKADYDTMQTVIEGLNLKFAIKQFDTWKKVITNRSESLIDHKNKSYNTFKTLKDDKDVLYLLSDTSTRIRSQLKIITGEYYTLKEAGNILGSHSSTTSLDGEKILRERINGFSNISSSVYYKAHNKTAFIDNRYIQMVQKSIPRINTNIIRRALQAISDEILVNEHDNTKNKIIHKSDGTDYYYGTEELISRIVYTIYNSAIHNPKINIRNKIMIYINTKNIYSAARSSDPILINVKYSLNELFKRTKVSRRESTVSGLTIAIALYITLISFEKI